MNTKIFTGSSLLVLSAFAFGDCAADKGLARKTKTIDRSSMTLGESHVQQEGDTLHVTGDVSRSDFSPVRCAGHVHVQLVNAAGEIVQSMTAPYSLPSGRKTPRTPGPRLARDYAQLSDPIPDGEIVRVAACSESRPPVEVKE